MELLSAVLHNYGPHSHSVIDFTEFRVAAILGRKGKDYRRSNGTGKSHVFDGISWCMFETARDDSNGDLLKWGEKKGFVKLKFIENGEKYLVKRTLTKKGERIHSALFLKHYKNGEWQNISDTGIGGKASTQKKIEDIIKANEEIFLHTCYIKQDEISALMKMRQNERREVFSRPEGLIMYQQGLKLARKRMSGLKTELQVAISRVKDSKLEFKEMFGDLANLKDLEEELKAKKNRRDEIKTTIADLEKEREKNSKSQSAKEKIKILRKAVDDAKLAVKEIEDANADLLDGGKQAEDSIAELEKKIRRLDLEALTSQKIQLSSALDKANDSIQSFKITVKEKQKRLDKVKRVCDECGNELTDDQFLDKKRTLKRELTNLDTQLEEAYEEKTKLETDLEGVNENLEKIKTLEKEKNKLKGRLSEYNAIWNKLDQARINFKKVRDENEPKIKDLEKLVVNTDGVDEQIEDQKERYSRINTKIGGLTERINASKDIQAQKIEKLIELKKLIRSRLALTRDFKILSTTIEMLKNMPNEIVKEAVPEIEQYSNEILSRFDQSNINLKIITEDDKGNEAFDWKVSIDGEETGFKSISGGEKMRVSFAFRIGNAIRLSHSRGCKFDFLLIDEVNALDDAGIEEFTDMIDKLSKMFKHIIVVSHEENIKQYFTNHLVVTKKGRDADVRLVKG